MELSELNPDPLRQFQFWYEDAGRDSPLEFFNAMALATADKHGVPSVRMVLLKEVNENGFTFVTSYESRKAREIAENPRAALCFFWEAAGRQVRVEGTVEKLAASESDAYFRTRPRSSQIGAWSSPQSSEIPSRQFLDEKVAENAKRFENEAAVPRPENWGGYRLRPDRFEFWKLGADRLHDRFEFSRGADGWTPRRLAP